MLRTLRAQQSSVENTDHRMSVYVTAALATGVSLLALAQPALSEVVVTKKTIPISPFAPAMLDLNKDGIPDFKLSFSGSNYGHSVLNSIHVDPLTGGQVVGTAAGPYGPYASALVRGANIGPSAHFVSGKNEKVLLARFHGVESGGLSSSTQGKWDNLGPDRFLGVKFAIHGETHYGWIRVTLNVAKVNGVSGTITAYAYETVANKKITVGVSTETTSASRTGNSDTEIGASLGMLALGAPGLEIWRRAESSSSEPTGRTSVE